MIRHPGLALLALCALALLPPSAAGAFTYGVNLHPPHVSTVDKARQTALVLSQRNIRSVRLDVSPFANITWLTQVVTAFKERNITVEAMLYDPTVNNYVCGTQATEQQAYDATKNIVNQMKHLITDWEIQNERQLKIAPGSSAMDAAPYYNDCGLREAAVNRGMSRAIRDVRASSGVPLRIILGFIGRGYGFLDFMLQQGVQFDVVGYHIYPWRNHPSLDTDPWFGTGGLFTNMARFNRPVRINEFNCAEIYAGDPHTPYGHLNDYENQPGQPLTEDCFHGIKKHLDIIKAQTKVNLEGVTFYELLDQPELSSEAESRFGLMYDLNTPKVHLMLVSAYAGGSLTSAERSQITSRGLLTDAQINANQAAAAGGPVAATMTHATYVAYLYRLVLGRDADAGGQQTWTQALESGASTRVGVQVAFLNSSEYQTYRLGRDNYTPAASMNALSNTDFVKYAYIVLFGRDPDTSGLTTYVNALNAGTTRATVVRTLMNSAEYKTRHGL
ncbi:DUF4214 domain-containing protein [Pyxidicoccus fallax]|uniref:DUF4214 domain-containing protein n=1 Tax=Pyxidicoccus fallax TaxID=394095 RepID=A0A848L5I6_9BACT|nr:DUF4214 domain-containing protein [Pyxidicoccus fallax]NMO13954.1 DUF4214 domain-containing protein [Pyxidicoccus fallax]NPC78353.1 DUF4214 domain-containing protein [Pyxidicoccus fallax]